MMPFAFDLNSPLVIGSLWPAATTDCLDSLMTYYVQDSCGVQRHVDSEDDNRRNS